MLSSSDDAGSLNVSRRCVSPRRDTADPKRCVVVRNSKVYGSFMRTTNSVTSWAARGGICALLASVFAWACFNDDSQEPIGDTRAAIVKDSGSTLTCDQQVDALLSPSSFLMPAIGYAPTAMAAFIDPLVSNMLLQKAVAGAPWPGATLSITRNGKLIFARAYGYANSDSNVQQYMEPDTLLRLASMSKPITALGVLKMIHDGQTTPAGPLALTTKPFAFLTPGPVLGSGKFVSAGGPTGPVPIPDGGCFPNTPPSDGIGVLTGDDGWNGTGGQNPLLANITVQELLHHSGGWARDYLTGADGGWIDAGNVPDLWATGMAWPGGLIPTAFASTGMPLTEPPSYTQGIEYLLNQPLQFMPGTNDDYSNIGYSALGEMIGELGTPLTYEQWITTNILSALGMNETFPGKTLTALDREATYYVWDCTSYNNAGVCTAPNNLVPGVEYPSVFPSDKGALRPQPYGGLVYLEGGIPSGGWVSSAIDMARLTTAVAHSTSQFLSIFGSSTPGWPADFYTYTDARSCPQAGWWWGWYGLGWDEVDPNAASGKDDLKKYGGMNGTATETWLTSTANGDDYTLTLLVNSSDPGSWPLDSTLTAIVTALNAAEDAGALSLPSSTADIFPQYNAAAYTEWQSATDFETTLSTAGKSNQYASRVDGQSIGTFYTYPICTPQEMKDDRCPPPILHDNQQFRARLADAPGNFGVPTVYKDQTCGQMITLIQSPGIGQVVSLQKFNDPVAGAWMYQAVFSTPPM
jgi:CubicO group peptidase (beta-lactamase class C family)